MERPPAPSACLAPEDHSCHWTGASPGGKGRAQCWAHSQAPQTARTDWERLLSADTNLPTSLRPGSASVGAVPTEVPVTATRKLRSPACGPSTGLRRVCAQPWGQQKVGTLLPARGDPAKPPLNHTVGTGLARGSHLSVSRLNDKKTNDPIKTWANNPNGRFPKDCRQTASGRHGPSSQRYPPTPTRTARRAGVDDTLSHRANSQTGPPGSTVRLAAPPPGTHPVT